MYVVQREKAHIRGSLLRSTSDRRVRRDRTTKRERQCLHCRSSHITRIEIDTRKPTVITVKCADSPRQRKIVSLPPPTFEAARPLTLLKRKRLRLFKAQSLEIQKSDSDPGIDQFPPITEPNDANRMQQTNDGDKDQFNGTDINSRDSCEALSTTASDTISSNIRKPELVQHSIDLLLAQPRGARNSGPAGGCEDSWGMKNRESVDQIGSISETHKRGRNSIPSKGDTILQEFVSCEETSWPDATTKQASETISEENIPPRSGSGTQVRISDYLILPKNNEVWVSAVELEARKALKQLERFCNDHAEEIREGFITRPIIAPFWAFDCSIPLPEFADHRDQKAYLELENSIRCTTSTIRTPFHPPLVMGIDGATAVQLLRFWCRYSVFWMLVNGATTGVFRTIANGQRFSRAADSHMAKFSPCYGCGGWIRYAWTLDECPLCKLEVPQPEPLNKPNMKFERFRFILRTIRSSLRRSRVIKPAPNFQMALGSAPPSILLTIINSLNLQHELIRLLRSLCPGLTYVEAPPAKACSRCGVCDKFASSAPLSHCHWCRSAMSTCSKTPPTEALDKALVDRISAKLGVTEPADLAKLKSHILRIKSWDTN